MLGENGEVRRKLGSHHVVLYGAHSRVGAVLLGSRHHRLLPTGFIDKLRVFASCIFLVKVHGVLAQAGRELGSRGVARARVAQLFLGEQVLGAHGVVRGLLGDLLETLDENGSPGLPLAGQGDPGVLEGVLGRGRLLLLHPLRFMLCDQGPVELRNRDFLRGLLPVLLQHLLRLLLLQFLPRTLHLVF